MSDRDARQSTGNGPSRTAVRIHFANESSFSSFCGDLIAALQIGSRDTAVSFAEQFVKSGQPSLAIAVANAYDQSTCLQDLRDEEWDIIQGVLSFPDDSVRLAGAQTLSVLVHFHLERTKALPLELEVGNDSQLAKSLFEVFPSHWPSLFPLSDDELERFLSKLCQIDNLGDYHIGQFLAAALNQNPIAKTTFLLDRIHKKSERYLKAVKSIMCHALFKSCMSAKHCLSMMQAKSNLWPINRACVEGRRNDDFRQSFCP